MKKLLQRWEIVPKVVLDGRQAVDAFLNEPYDLILLDLHMPKLDGFKAAKIIYDFAGKSNLKVYIIALTASSDNEVRDAIEASGIDDYLGKPSQIADLEGKIKKVVSSKMRNSNQ